jgi:single-stranded-DNA-specific exonuclease
VASGSGRSIAAFHLLDALESMREIFTKFGGHAHAAGVTLQAVALEEFRERLRQWAFERLTPEDMRPEVKIDAVVDLSEVNDALWLALEQMAPFGMDNPKPRFAARAVDLTSPPTVWKEKHLRFTVRQGKRILAFKGWGLAHLAAELADVKTIDVAFEIERGWQGGWDLIARAARPAA